MDRYSSQVAFEIWGPEKVLQKLYDDAPDLFKTSGMEKDLGERALIWLNRPSSGLWALRYFNLSLEYNQISLERNLEESRSVIEKQFILLWKEVVKQNLPATFISTHNHNGRGDSIYRDTSIDDKCVQQQVPNLYARPCICADWLPI